MTASPAPGDWLASAVDRLRRSPDAVRTLFPAAGRGVGRAPLDPATDPTGVLHGTADDAARVRLVEALAQVVPGEELTRELADLYRYGDDAERRGVLRSLAAVDGRVDQTAALGLVTDALRANDVRLVAAALGPYASRHLDDHAFRHGVLKCLFLGIPLDAVTGWRERTDAELARMVADYAAERRAAGRAVPADADRVLAAAPDTQTQGERA